MPEEGTTLFALLITALLDPKKVQTSSDINCSDFGQMINFLWQRFKKLMRLFTYIQYNAANAMAMNEEGSKVRARL